MGNSFRFRLQSVTKLRERDRDDAAEALRQALRAKQILEGQVTEIETERSQQNELRKATQTGSVDLQKTIDAQRYQFFLDSQVADLQEQISLIEQECQRRRTKLVKSEQAVRSLEKLEEHQRAEWSAQQASNEQSTLDQWSSFRYWSNNQIDDSGETLQQTDK